MIVYDLQALVRSFRSVSWSTPMMVASQRAQYPLTKEHSLNHHMVGLSGLFFCAVSAFEATSAGTSSPQQTLRRRRRSSTQHLDLHKLRRGFRA